ncbi:hypothetical protein [Xanthobacter sp. VNH20]|uniref:hypothetical protein n=1 Tax=Xanthobacter sp. VNH20 TaxID=3156616 RepID=UPI0032B6236D
MASDVKQRVVKKIRTLYKNDAPARLIFDWGASRERETEFTTIDRIAVKARIDRSEAIALARKLQEAECGEFILGRRGSKSRFRWDYSFISLGQAASGEVADIDTLSDDARGREEDDLPEDAKLPVLTIPQAKEALSRSLGVPVESIEILVKG